MPKTYRAIVKALIMAGLCCLVIGYFRQDWLFWIGLVLWVVFLAAPTAE